MPAHFLAFLRNVGAGDLGGSFMIYGGLVEPWEIFGHDRAGRLEGVLFLGDNYCGSIVGFDTRDDWQLVSVDSSSLEVEAEGAKTTREYFEQRVDDFDSA